MAWSYNTSTTTPNITYTIGDPNKDFSVYVNNIIETNIDKQMLKKIFKQEDEIKKELEAEKAAAELKKVQERNKRLRGLIEKVTFSGPVTVVKWNDGTITRVRCAEGEVYDQEKGLLAAMAKKLYENTNIFVEELAYWCDDPDDDDYDDDDFEAYRQTIDERDWKKLRDWFEHGED